MSKPDIITVEEAKAALLTLEALVCPTCGLPIIIPLPPGVGRMLPNEHNITDWCQNYCGYFVLHGESRKRLQPQWEWHGSLRKP
jgi:hypothetical protein